MKEIGQKLKETRINMDISVEEAAEDLKLSPSQIEDIEEGNMEVFKDIFYLKYFIRDYSKYLGLDYEDMVDEFNEYLFDYTSKISLDDIKKAKHNLKKNDDIIKSPYTIERKNNKKFIYFWAFILVVVVFSIFLYFSLYKNSINENEVIAINYIR